MAEIDVMAPVAAGFKPGRHTVSVRIIDRDGDVLCGAEEDFEAPEWVKEGELWLVMPIEASHPEGVRYIYARKVEENAGRREEGYARPLEDDPGVLEIGFEAREDGILKGFKISVDGGEEIEVKFRSGLSLRGGDYYVLRIPGLRTEPRSHRIKVTFIKAKEKKSTPRWLNRIKT